MSNRCEISPAYGWIKYLISDKIKSLVNVPLVYTFFNYTISKNRNNNNNSNNNNINNSNTTTTTTTTNNNNNNNDSINLN